MIVAYMNGVRNKQTQLKKAGSQNRRPCLPRSSGIFTENIQESLKRFSKTKNTATRGGV